LAVICRGCSLLSDGPIVVGGPKTDFATGRFGYRAARFGQSEPLLRAVGSSKSRPLSIVDATAGLGHDGFLLAASGAQVTLIERSSVMFAELERALLDARQNDDLAEIAARMTVLHGDSRDLLRDIKADVFYIDPMHPERKKSALVKEPMRLLRDVVGDDSDSAELIQIALQHSPGRVVVKWPAKADLPDGIPQPSYELKSRTTRYCVFIGAPDASKIDSQAL
jgi:16S rRNA (guanine1516-N2)-methyltransferase